MDNRFGPFKRMGFGIMSLDKPIDCLAQLPYRGEAGPTQGTATQDAKPALDLIEPTGSGWRVMEMNVRVTGQPVISFGFVRVQIV